MSDGCGGCAVSGRRDFLLDSARAGAAALAALGLMPTGVSAMPLGWITPVESRGDEKSYAIPAADGVQIDKGSEVILARV